MLNLLNMDKHKLNSKSKKSVEACLTLFFKSLNISLCDSFGYTYGQSGLSAPLLNAAFDCHLKEEKLTVAIEQITDHFRKLNLPHSWWFETSKEPAQLKYALAKEGLELCGVVSGMCINLPDFIFPHHQTDFEIIDVQTKEDLLEWSNLICEVFGFHGKLAEGYSLLYQNSSYSDDFIHLIGKKNGKIICTGSLLYHNSVSYLFNICTLESERNNGYAAAITRKLFIVTFLCFYAFIQKRSKKPSCRFLQLPLKPTKTSPD